MFSRLRLGSVVAEYIGTAILVMVALVLVETTAVSYFIATSLALTLAVIVAVFGSVSGAHVNPAITFGMWTARRITTLRTVAYIGAQLLGGLTAWQLYQYLTDKDVAAKAVTFSTRIWLAEAIGTFILALGVTAALTKAFDSIQASVAAGTAIFAGIMVASVASAGYINPAIALGLRSWGTAYVLGPLVGGLVAVNLYTLLFAPEFRPFRVPRISRARLARPATSTAAKTTKRTRTTKTTRSRSKR